MKKTIVGALVFGFSVLPVLDAAAHPHYKRIKRGKVIVTRPVVHVASPYYYTGSYNYSPWRVKPKKTKSYGVVATPAGFSFYYNRGYGYPYYW
jgi:hypothetical protein